MFGVFAAAVEDGVGLDFEALAVLQVDDRNVVVGRLDVVVAGDQVTQVKPSPAPRRRWTA